MSPPATCKIRSSRRQSSLLFCGHQGVTQLLTTRQSGFYQEPARIAVAKRSIAENRVISGLERALGPARACQNSGARDLEDPCARWRAVLGVGLDDAGNVRIGPIDGLDGGFHGLGMLEIVCRIRMMRRSDTAKSQHQARNNESRFWRYHLNHPLLHCVDRTVRALRIWNEDVVAELILPRGKVFLSAFTFGNLIMTLGIATEDSRRFPACVQDLRRGYFEVVVKNVRLRQMQPFEDVHVAIVGYADRLADRNIGLRRDRDGVDHQRVAVPMPDRVAVKGQIGVFGMRTAVQIDTSHPVAV